MSDAIVIEAQKRDRVGKGAARAVRRAGQVPAVVYGGKQEPLPIALSLPELKRRLRDPAFFTHVYEIKVDGKTHRALARDIQFDPVLDFPVHLDFLRVGQSTMISVAVPVEFLNEEESPGLKEGGVLNVVRHEIEVTCRAMAIPDKIEIDLTGLEVGVSIHISDIKLPDGVEPSISDRDFTIATIAAPLVSEPEPEEGEAAEGEEAEGDEGESAEDGEAGEGSSDEDQS